MTAIKYNDSSGFPSAWVEWKHISTGLTHCKTCLRLDKCWFAEGNMPELPQHEFCHCTAVPKSDIMVQMQATAESAYTKYDRFYLIPMATIPTVKNTCSKCGAIQ